MLYSADATVLVLTEPAFREVIATLMACTYGVPTNNIDNVYLVQGLALLGIVSSATNRGSIQIWLTRPVRKRSFVFSETQVQKGDRR